MARMAASRPGPGPFTNTSTSFNPRSFAERITSSAAFLAAKGVLFREPLNPEDPALPQTTTFPCGSEMETIVLLNVACMFARPLDMVRLVLLRFDSLRAIILLTSSLRPFVGRARQRTSLNYFFFAPLRRPRPATVFLGPFLVRALVRVR